MFTLNRGGLYNTECTSECHIKNLSDYVNLQSNVLNHIINKLQHFQLKSPIKQHQGLQRLNIRKAAGPNKVCPRVLRVCATELGGPC